MATGPVDENLTDEEMAWKTASLWRATAFLYKGCLRNLISIIDRAGVELPPKDAAAVDSVRTALDKDKTVL